MHWAVSSPSLLSYPFSTTYVRNEAHATAILELLHQADSRSDEVDAHFAALGSMPMGKYFEQLLFYVLERDVRFEVLLKNHQLIQGKHTVGEIDLILKDTVSGQVEHWEIALKFYLQYEAKSDHEVMLGPNAIDTLAKKMRKLNDHQLPISTDLSNAGIPSTENITDRLFMKGQFFYHLSRFGSCNIFPYAAATDHERGWWCYLHEVEKALLKDMRWTTLWKPDWIGNIQTEDSVILLNYSEMQESLEYHFKEEVHSILCVGLRYCNGLWHEVTRGFVVNDAWPNT